MATTTTTRLNGIAKLVGDSTPGHLARGGVDALVGAGRAVKRYADTHTPQEAASDAVGAVTRVATGGAQALLQAAYEHRDDPAWLTKELFKSTYESMDMGTRSAIKAIQQAQRVQNNPNITEAEKRKVWQAASIATGMVGLNIATGGEGKAAKGGLEIAAEDAAKLGVKGPKYPMAPPERWYGSSNYAQHGGRIAEMTPDEYLSRTRPLQMDDVSRDNIDDLKGHIQRGGELDPPAIYADGKEDGRHRAHAAKELGIDRIPVLLFGDEKLSAPKAPSVPAVGEVVAAPPHASLPAAGEAARVSGAGEAAPGPQMVGYHGSPKTDLSSVRTSERGALGPGAYFTPNEGVAARYAGPEGKTYAADLSGVFDGMHWPRNSSVNPYQVWRDQVAKLVDADPQRAEEIGAIAAKMQPQDGYPFFKRIAAMYGSEQDAQDLFRKAGFKGVAGHADGPEIAMFDEVPIPGAAKPKVEFAKPGVEPIHSQAARMGVPITGPDPFYAAHAEGYTSLKGGMKPEDVTADYRPMFQMPDRKVVSPEALEGSLLVPLNGDKTIAGRTLLGVNGEPLAFPVDLHGGPRFKEMQEAAGNPAIWASEKGALNRLKKQVQMGFDQGLDVHGAYTAMGPTSGDQTTMMTDALMSQIAQKGVSKQAAATFNEDARKIIPDFVGIENPEAAAEQLRGLSGGSRMMLVQMMDAAKFKKLGLPDVMSTRVAITEPDLLHAPTGSSGYSVAKFDPALLHLDDPNLPHPTYNAQTGGQSLGGFEDHVPARLLYPDFFNARREAGAPMNADPRAFDMTKPTQVMRPDVIDPIMSYLEKIKQYR